MWFLIVVVMAFSETTAQPIDAALIGSNFATEIACERARKELLQKDERQPWVGTATFCVKMQVANT